MKSQAGSKDADRFASALRHILTVKPDQIDPKAPVRPHPPKKRKPPKKK